MFHENGRVKTVKPVYLITGDAAESETLVKRTVNHACTLKECPMPQMTEIGAEASMLSENHHSSLSDAFVEFEKEWSTADNNPIIFGRIIRKLLPNDLVLLACVMEMKYYREKLNMEIEFDSSGRGGEQVGANNDGFLMICSVPAMASTLAKILSEKVINSTLGHSSSSTSCVKPYEDATTAIGVVLIISAIVLKDMKPGLSKSMAKVGLMAVAFAALLPLALALNPAAALIFGLLMAFIVVGSLAQI